jgi:hypothetical protein
MVRQRSWWWIGGFLLLLSLPARFASMKQSLWLDEAWVANSLLEPSLHDVFYEKAWSQSSPPLFLLLERWFMSAAGASEAAMRILPLVASLAGLMVAGTAMRRWLSAPASLLAFTLLAANYWLIKYPQQIKQYATDFLVSAVLLWLMGNYLGNCESSRNWTALLTATVAGWFLSWTTLFWMPAVLVCSAIGRGSSEDQGPRLRDLFSIRTAWAAGFLALVVVFSRSVFIAPNLTPDIFAYYRPDYLDPLHSLISLEKVIYTLGLLLGAMKNTAVALGLAAGLLAAYAAYRAIAESRAGNHLGRMILLAGVSPLCAVLTAGAVHAYPVLHYPRMLMCVLPSLALLLGFGIEALLAPVVRPQRELKPAVSIAIAAICFMGILASQFVYFRYPRPAEENRPALAFIKSQFEPDDLLFVHGGMYEQFKFYRHALDFSPHRLYLGKDHWPCCPKAGDFDQVTTPGAKDFASDLLEARSRAGGHRLWLLFPAGTPGHWSSSFRSEIQSIPGILNGGGCIQNIHRLYGQTLIEAYSCP